MTDQRLSAEDALREALDDSAFTRTLRAYADRAHDNVSYRTLVPEVVLRDAAAVIDDYRARPAAPAALDVERLARAMSETDGQEVEWDAMRPNVRRWWLDWATRLHARLAKTEEPSDD